MTTTERHRSPSRRRWWLLATIIGPVLLLSATAASAAPAAWDRTGDEVGVEARLFDRHNDARQRPGDYGYPQLSPRPALRWSQEIADVARAWSDELARTHDFRHNPDRAAQLGAGTAENIIWVRAGAASTDRPPRIGDPERLADQLLQRWMDSEGHRSNIMDRRWDAVGLGVTQAADGTVYATAVFRSELSGLGTSRATYPSPTAVEPHSRCTGTAHPLVGDWEADGSDGIGWWCDGRVRLRTAGGTVHRFAYGRTGDVPVVADWNGDGRDTVSVIRDGTWHVNNRLEGGPAERTFVYGRVVRGDLPIAGDWNRGGRDLPGIVRDGTWHLRLARSGGPSDRAFVFGRLLQGDLAVWGDWNADGRTSAGVVREGTWYLRDVHRGGTADRDYVFGRVNDGDRPVVGDWTGDGRDTPAIVRGDEWYVRYQHGGGNADEVWRFHRP